MNNVKYDYKKPSIIGIPIVKKKTSYRHRSNAFDKKYNKYALNININIKKLKL